MIKKVRASGFSLEKQARIIPFNEVVFKERSDITIITTGFTQTGRTKAQLILENKVAAYMNPLYLIHCGRCKGYEN